MAAKPRITIVGAGNLGRALGLSLRKAGYRVEAVVARAKGGSLTRARRLANELGARAVTLTQLTIEAEVVWLCVPDAQIAGAAESLAGARRWNGQVVFHSSGPLTSDELGALRRRGAVVASIHPLMTFVRKSRPSLEGIAFAIEGDTRAVRVARRIVQDLGGTIHAIPKRDKAAYHAWGTFASPLLTAFLATTEQVAAGAGVSGKEARKRMLPILQQTLSNYMKLGAADSFSGPIVRGDVEIVKRHLRVLREIPAATEVYLALAKAALRYLPAKNRRLLQDVLNQQHRA